MGRIIKFLLFLLFVGLIAIQFVEVEKTNPPVTADFRGPLDVKNIFKKSCYDCHSNETVWPWYSNVAPISWLVSNDVKEGRGHLNFSEWEKLSSAKKKEYAEEIWEVISKEEMPLPIYTWLHPAAKLDLPQKNIIKKWAVGSGIVGMND